MGFINAIKSKEAFKYNESSLFAKKWILNMLFVQLCIKNGLFVAGSIEVSIGMLIIANSQFPLFVEVYI